jgi:hypothetical protein
MKLEAPVVLTSTNLDDRPTPGMTGYYVRYYEPNEETGTCNDCGHKLAPGRCPICGSDIDLDVDGLAVYRDGDDRPLCADCRDSWTPFLTALCRLADAAIAYSLMDPAANELEREELHRAADRYCARRQDRIGDYFS